MFFQVDLNMILECFLDSVCKNEYTSTVAACIALFVGSVLILGGSGVFLAIISVLGEALIKYYSKASSKHLADQVFNSLLVSSMPTLCS